MREPIQAIVSLQNRLNLNAADWKKVAIAAIVSLQNRLNLNLYPFRTTGS